MGMLPPVEFVVLGGGLAGRRLACDLARLGQQGILIEYHAFGGATLNVACLPDAMLVRAARIARQIRRGEGCGVGQGDAGVDLGRLFSAVGATVSAARSHDLALWPADRVELVIGQGRLIEPDRVEVALADGTFRRVRTRRVFVATGTTVATPDIPGLSGACPLTPRELFRLTRVPPQLAILGASFGGMAYAQAFAALGAEVTLIDEHERVARFEDAVFSDALAQQLRHEGVRLLTSTRVSGVSGLSGEGVTLSLEQGRQQFELDASDILLAGARQPLTRNIGLEAVGVRLDAHGCIVVDETLKSSVDGIYALGDVAAYPTPGHAVSDDARVALSLYGAPPRTTAGRVLPRIAFVDPEYARIGLSEAEARQAGIAVRVCRLPMHAVTRAWSEGELGGLMQAVLAEDDGRILGFAMLGIGAGDVTSAVQVAMHAGLPAAALAELPLAHPTAAEALNVLFAGGA